MLRKKAFYFSVLHIILKLWSQIDLTIYSNDVNIWVSAKKNIYRKLEESKKYRNNPFYLSIFHIIAMLQLNWWNFKFWMGWVTPLLRRMCRFSCTKGPNFFTRDLPEPRLQITLRNHTRQNSSIFDYFWVGRSP